METATNLSCCSNPGCDQPGTSKCSACKTEPYCGPICQTAHWTKHKEECEGHLLKIGNAHLMKAEGFFDADNWVQALRYSDLALVKLNAMKKRPLESISAALTIKCHALKCLGQHPEGLQCAKDKYNLWALARGPAHPSTIDAAFYLIESLLFNDEYEDAETYAVNLWEIIHTNNHRDNDIPGEEREEYVAKAAGLLAQATYRLAASGGIPPEEKQQAGELAIARARQSLEINTQLFGTESTRVATTMGLLAGMLEYFNNDDDDEVLGLYQQAITIETRESGSASMNVGTSMYNLGLAYDNRAEKAHAANDLDREQANLELALPRYREAARIYTAINHTQWATSSLRDVVDIDQRLRQLGIVREAAEAEAKATEEEVEEREVGEGEEAEAARADEVIFP